MAQIFEETAVYSDKAFRDRFNHNYGRIVHVSTEYFQLLQELGGTQLPPLFGQTLDYLFLNPNMLPFLCPIESAFDNLAHPIRSAIGYANAIDYEMETQPRFSRGSCPGSRMPGGSPYPMGLGSTPGVKTNKFPGPARLGLHPLVEGAVLKERFQDTWRLN